MVLAPPSWDPTLSPLSLPHHPEGHGGLSCRNPQMHGHSSVSDLLPTPLPGALSVVPLGLPDVAQQSLVGSSLPSWLEA